MLAMLGQFLEVLALVFKGLLSVLSSMVTLVTLIPQFIAFILSMVAVAPPFVSSFIIVGVTASVLLLILGRN